MRGHSLDLVIDGEGDVGDGGAIRQELFQLVGTDDECPFTAGQYGVVRALHPGGPVREREVSAQMAVQDATGISAQVSELGPGVEVADALGHDAAIAGADGAASLAKIAYGVAGVARMIGQGGALVHL